MATIANAHIGRGHYRVTINSGKNVIIADEAEDKGGKDEGFDPFELFVASLAACTCATVRMYADRKQMSLEEIKVNLSLEKDDEQNVTNITRVVEFIGNLSAEQRARLLEIANKCPVHKIMSNPIHITTQMI